MTAGGAAFFAHDAWRPSVWSSLRKAGWSHVGLTLPARSCLVRIANPPTGRLPGLAMVHRRLRGGRRGLEPQGAPRSEGGRSCAWSSHVTCHKMVGRTRSPVWPQQLEGALVQLRKLRLYRSCLLCRNGRFRRRASEHEESPGECSTCAPPAPGWRRWPRTRQAPGQLPRRITQLIYRCILRCPLLLEGKDDGVRIDVAHSRAPAHGQHQKLDAGVPTARTCNTELDRHDNSVRVELGFLVKA